MIQKEQWIILPFSEVKDLPHLRISPPGVVPQRDRRPRWIVDYTFSGVNQDTAPIVPPDAMQFGHALERLLREILFSNPAHGPVYIIKIDIADGFYRIGVRPEDVPKLGVVFPTLPGQEPLVAFPITLPMGWKNSPPLFCTATETGADLANYHIRTNKCQATHPLDTLATVQDVIHPTTERTQPPVSPDPSLYQRQQPKAYTDVYMDDYLMLGQGNHSRLRQLRSTLMTAIDSVFRPLDEQDSSHRQEPISIKKLQKGDCSWNTTKLALGWLLNTEAMTLTLPLHRSQRLCEILSSIPPTQKRTSINKWHKVLGELRSMAVALPGARGLFSQLQQALTTAKGGRLNLHKGIHQSISDFKWMHTNIATRPTRIQELIPLTPTITGDHDASGAGAGGVLFPAPTATPRQPFNRQPVIWRIEWPEEVTKQLITLDNPNGTFTNSDLELAGALLQLEAASQCFDVRERTVLCRTDNLNTLFWSRKGSASTVKPTAHLLRQLALHQRLHRYVPRHDYVPGPANNIADDASRLFHLSHTQFLAHFNSNYPLKRSSYQVWTPNSQFLSAIHSALLKRPYKRESLNNVPKPPTPIGTPGPSSQLHWGLTPFSRGSKTKSPSFRYSRSESAMASFPVKAREWDLDKLRITYGRLAKRSSLWGPKTHVTRR